MAEERKGFRDSERDKEAVNNRAYLNVFIKSSYTLFRLEIGAINMGILDCVNAQSN